MGLSNYHKTIISLEASYRRRSYAHTFKMGMEKEGRNINDPSEMNSQWHSD